MKVSRWSFWKCALLALGALPWSREAFAQEGAPVPLPVAVEQAPASGRAPTYEEYQDLVRRLEASEEKLKILDQNYGEISRLPEVHEPDYVHADGSPDVPSSEQRFSALERALGKKQDKGPSFPSVKLTGFMQVDTGFFDQDANSRATLGDIQDGVGFRRARLQAIGKVAEFTNYSLEMDFATAGRPSFMDVWGEQTNIPFFGNLRVGHYRQPVSMDSWTPVRQLEFLERSLPFQAFDPFRRVGVMAYDKSENEMMTWAYGVYRTGGFGNAPLGDSRFATDIGDNGGFSFASRATKLLYYDEPSEGRYLLHLGGSYNYSQITATSAGGGFYEARVIPEFFVGDPAGGGVTSAGTPFIADTGRIRATDYSLYGVELAGQYGAAHFQAEYMGTSVTQTAGPGLYYDGAYIQGGYFLTGENRTYNRMFGVFDRIVPYSDFFALGRNSYVCGWGAWEVCARWSYVNLYDANAVTFAPAVGPPASPNPGRVNNATVGLNWYWNTYTKVQFNYIHSMLDNTLTDKSNCNIYCARFEVDF